MAASCCGRSWSTPALEQVVSLAYPAGDLLLLAMLVRLLAAAGTRSAAGKLVAAATIAMLVADGGFQYATLTTGYGGDAFDALWVAASVLWGTAALHPSMRRLSDPEPLSRVDFSRSRLLVLTGAGLLPPGTLVVQLLLGERLEAWAVAISSILVFVLVVARMSTLLELLRRQSAQLADLARTDPLTRLLNRRSADAEMDRMRIRAQLDDVPLVVALLDLDRFKAYNDTYGHPAGDRLLVGASSSWRVALAGTGAVLARWGGEEFVLVAAGHTGARIGKLLEDLRPLVPAAQTFSAGVAVWDREEPLTDLVARADTALYAAKHAGRNCTRTAPGGTRVAV